MLFRSGMWLDKRLFFLALSWVMVLAPFPTIFFLMWNRNLQLTRNLKEAMEMNGHLSRRISPEVGIASLEDKVFSSEEALVFAGGTKEMLEVKAGDFLYAEAKGNYVKVGYRSDSDKEKKITWRLLRASSEAELYFKTKNPSEIVPLQEKVYRTLKTE